MAETVNLRELGNELEWAKNQVRLHQRALQREKNSAKRESILTEIDAWNKAIGDLISRGERAIIEGGARIRAEMGLE